MTLLRTLLLPFLLALTAVLLPSSAWASATDGAVPLDLTGTWFGIASIVIFTLAYALVMGEEALHLRKSKPVMVAAGLIWALIGLAYARAGDTHTAETAIRHNLLEFGELFLFLLAAMTFINTLDDRRVFDALRAWLVGRGFSLRGLFWVTGALAFCISPIADNLTTALLMGAVVLAVGAGKPKFIAVACINVVVAANAGGAFSPFGDITTLMVWQKGLVTFGEFFDLFLPSLVNWLVPATLMAFSIEKGKPDPITEKIEMRRGAMPVLFLFVGTIVLSVCFHNFLHLPPVLGMMTGLGVLKLYGYFMSRAPHPQVAVINEPDDVFAEPLAIPHAHVHKDRFDVFKQLERAEWDTLMFFYGVIVCVGGLGTLGYLTLASNWMYGDLGPTAANVLVGLLSAVVDNIPVMFAVLSMNPDMSHGQWLLVTLTAGVGGSLLSVGSAAGVALMGQARGVYTFLSHLRWTWAIALGYAASIGTHLVINRALF
ncbi:sodium:proton antiporter NhaD [bacterium]|nr:sodium:proton antiporter NhaD [bacterium]